MPMRTVDDWKAVLRTALRDSMRARDPEVTSMLRETLAAIDNAEAQDASLAPTAQSGVIAPTGQSGVIAPTGQSGVIAGAVQGLGAGEVARRVLTPEEVVAIVMREVVERREAAASYVSLGRSEEAKALDRQADMLESLIGEASKR